MHQCLVIVKLGMGSELVLSITVKRCLLHLKFFSLKSDDVFVVIRRKVIIYGDAKPLLAFGYYFGEDYCFASALLTIAAFRGNFIAFLLFRDIVFCVKGNQTLNFLETWMVGIFINVLIPHINAHSCIADVG